MGVLVPEVLGVYAWLRLPPMLTSDQKVLEASSIDLVPEVEVRVCEVNDPLFQEEVLE